MKKIFILLIFVIFNITSLNASSDYTKGFMFYKKGHKLLNKDSDKSYKYFSKAKPYLLSSYKSSSARSAFMLGRMYCNGWGVTLNYKTAEKYFKDALNWGDKRSNCCLSRLYIMFLKTDIPKGEKYFKTAQKYNIPDCKDIKEYIKQNNLFDID